jgi:hypothetical protein
MSYIFRGPSLFFGCNDIATKSVSHILLESHYCFTAVGSTCKTVEYNYPTNALLYNKTLI